MKVTKSKRMFLQNKNDIQFLQFESFTKHNVMHGFFMRHGGVSLDPWRSLNLGGNNGDPRANVVENRRRIFVALDRPVESLFDVWQVHSDTIICADSPRQLDSDPLQADAILTDNPDITLFMRFADCVPVCLFDPVTQVAGMIHAGWPGTVKKITYKTVLKMVKNYGSKPENIIAGIGPSICVNHFEIKKDVIEQVINHLSPDGDRFLVHQDGRTYFNLQTANEYQLNLAGVIKVETAGVCTACNTKDWFSHRGEKGSTGRFGALLAL